MTFGLIGAMVVTGDARPIAARQRHQQARIVGGLRSGQLTVGECRQLERRKAHVAATARRRQGGGLLTRRERAHVGRLINRQSRLIARYRHNRRRR